MRNKPFAVVETDGHSGDAGTKTRMEAFLFCVDGDRRTRASESAEVTSLKRIEDRKVTLNQVRKEKRTLLIPRMGSNVVVAAAALRVTVGTPRCCRCPRATTCAPGAGTPRARSACP